MRLHPLSILYRVLENGGRIVAIMLFAGFSGSTLPGGAAAPLLLAFGGVALAVGWEVAYYRRFEYDLTPDTLDIDSGVLSRRAREIPYERIQNVDVSQNVIQRALEIAELRVETAGGSQTEATLRYVDEDEAARLKAELGRRKRGESGEAGRGEPEAEPETTLFEMSSRELGVLSLVSMDVRFVPLLFLGLSVFAPSLTAGVDPRTISPLLLGPLYTVGAVAVLAFISGVAAVLNYYDFELSGTADEFRYERGLLQRYSGTIPREKVQSLTIRENVLARLVDHASLDIETAGYAPGSGNQRGSQAIVPLAQRDHAMALAHEVADFGELSFERPPKRARLRYVARYSIVVAVLTGLAYAAVTFTGLTGPWWALLGLLAVVPVAAHLKWRNLGYALLDDYIVTRQGFWSRRIQVVPYYRVQTVFSSATIFQRRRDLATLTVDTAGSRSLLGNQAAAVDIDGELARDLRETVEDRLQDSLAARRNARRLSALRSRPDREREDLGSAGATPGGQM